MVSQIELSAVCLRAVVVTAKVKGLNSHGALSMPCIFHTVITVHMLHYTVYHIYIYGIYIPEYTGRGLPYGSGLGLSRCLGPGLILIIRGYLALKIVLQTEAQVNLLVATAYTAKLSQETSGWCAATMLHVEGPRAGTNGWSR